MRAREIKELVDSTSDCAFAVDGRGVVVAWNGAAEEMFGVGVEQAIGMRCGEILRGMDECGVVCSEDCSVKQAVKRHHPVRNFDLQVETR